MNSIERKIGLTQREEIWSIIYIESVILDYKYLLPIDKKTYIHLPLLYFCIYFFCILEIGRS